ncbi:hypothetical protein [Fibrivirga algicola]|uniref:Adhesin domain-containing protein n=1 Tax=Fibrivirga algicola TaxID=2950420 RepID=A0ABX0Q9D7_9BACT|nr:hypothetical protein [Fibrivirga algicola]ARK09160.1 hypothetical protein A6C57_01840 [Fibrella sp. ES10-3-2-2]NID08725.1 hypothetical protein [Fibrivirga algicola]
MSLFNPYLVIAACLLTARALAQSPDEQLKSVAKAAPEQLVILSPQALMDFQELSDDRTEVNRTIVKSFTVDAKNALSIDNRFGDVIVSLWDRNEMRVEIAIRSSSENADRARQALNAVSLDERRDGDTYLFKTVIASEFEGGWKKGDRRNFLRVDYRISMPKANKLAIKNSFGNTTIPDFWAPLSVESSFGNVYGAALNNLTTKIKASYGNVSIRDLQHGNVVMSFGDLDINSGNVLSIQQTYGKLNLGETNKLDVRTSYTDALIGSVRQSGKFRMNYARQFRLERIGASADKIDVEASYSTIALPVQSTPNCDFDVTVSHGGFSYPTLPNLQLLSQPGTPPNSPTGVSVTAPARPARVRQYVGKVGTGEGPSIKVVATYGDVRFNK